jgi:hypothetical protein
VSPITQGPQATLFHSSTTGFGGSVMGTSSMMDVLGSTGAGIGALGPYIVAALLNARAGRTPVLDETAVRTMWNDLVNRGSYEVSAGINWGPAEIVSYLKTTMG